MENLNTSRSSEVDVLVPGDLAPDFDIESVMEVQEHKPFSLSSKKGKYVILMFHELDPAEIFNFDSFPPLVPYMDDEDMNTNNSSLDLVLLVISKKHSASKSNTNPFVAVAGRGINSFTVTLGCDDPDGSLAKIYGANPYTSSSFTIDPEGKIIAIDRNIYPLTEDRKKKQMQLEMSVYQAMMNAMIAIIGNTVIGQPEN